MDFQQQDSQEFLRFLLDGMSEDLCRKHSEVEQGGAVGGAGGGTIGSVSGVGSTRSGGGGGNGGGILPMLPSPSLSLTNPTNHNINQANTGTSSSPDFSRTLPTHLHTSNTINTDVFSMSLSAQNSPVGNPLRTSHTTKLRDQAHSSRQDDLRVSMLKSHSAMHGSADGTTSNGNGVYGFSGSNDETEGPMQIPRLRNNNHEEETHPTNTNTGTTNITQQTPSKYVSRLRKFSAASPDEPQLSVFSPESKQALHTIHSLHIPQTQHTQM